MERILAACDRYTGNKDRMKAFILVMRHSGLRISDTIALTKDRIKRGKLQLRAEKTGTDVYVPLPPTVTRALAKLEALSSGRYFSSGNAKPPQPAQTGPGTWTASSTLRRSKTATRIASATRSRCPYWRRASRSRPSRSCSGMRA